MCFMSAPKTPPPAPPPKVELPEAPPTPAMADVKQQTKASSAGAITAGDAMGNIRRRVRRSLTIGSAIGTPGMGA